MEAAINRYKYADKTGWGIIFGRILVGFLEKSQEQFRSFDLIVPSPTFVGDGQNQRRWDHVLFMLQKASRASDGSWPFVVEDPPVLLKARPTRRLVSCSGWTERRDVCKTEVRESLEVPDPNRTRGMRIVVVDDVFTDGLNLNEIARALVVKGEAACVWGLSLARQPWKS